MRGVLNGRARSAPAALQRAARARARPRPTACPAVSAGPAHPPHVDVLRRYLALHLHLAGLQGACLRHMKEGGGETGGHVKVCRATLVERLSRQVLGVMPGPSPPPLLAPPP